MDLIKVLWSMVTGCVLIRRAVAGRFDDDGRQPNVGAARPFDCLEVKWPGGAVRRFTNLALGRYITIVEGGHKWE